MKKSELLDFNEALQHPGKRQVFGVRTELPEEEDLDLLEPISGEVEGISTGNILLLKAKLKTRLVVECARCGSPIEMDLPFDMEDEIPVEGVPSSFSHEGFAKVVPEEDYPLFQGNSLMRDNYLRQGLLLNMPLQTLCTGSWDIPCPGASELDSDPHFGHPSLQGLASLKKSEDLAP